MLVPDVMFSGVFSRVKIQLRLRQDVMKLSSLINTQTLNGTGMFTYIYHKH